MPTATMTSKGQVTIPAEVRAASTEARRPVIEISLGHGWQICSIASNKLY